jgi:peptidoglycan/xylan/chitin deacetylase (PgdA/CDA1 family)
MGISTEHFFKHVQFLKKHYQIVSLPRAIEMLKTNSVYKPTVVLTFDDGYQENFINLRAVVEQTGVPITLFVSTDHVTRQREFAHDIGSGFGGFMPFTWEQLRQLQTQGFSLGSHTRTHFDCGSTNIDELKNEIIESKKEIEQAVGTSVTFFSFPFGLPENISPEAAELALNHYDCVLSAFGGNNISRSGGGTKHMRRWCHSSDLWSLELMMQESLEAVPSCTQLDGATEPVCSTELQPSFQYTEGAD